MKGRIAEVFESIQGEGIYLGEAQVFVRFFGCNLKCGFCDTPLDRFTEYEPEELLEEIKLYQNEYHSVSFTGGEPLLQKDFLKEALKLTHQAGYRNYLETNGTLYNELGEVIEHVDIVAMDLKLPSSTGLNDFWQEHRRALKIASQKETFLKMVVCLSTKEEDVREGLRLIKEMPQHFPLVLQPNSYEDEGRMQPKLARFKNLAIENDIIACIIPQVHKKTGME
jgi:7-carboxy-7-deazaguanine synthase